MSISIDQGSTPVSVMAASTKGSGKKQDLGKGFQGAFEACMAAFGLVQMQATSPAPALDAALAIPVGQPTVQSLSASESLPGAATLSTGEAIALQAGATLPSAVSACLVQASTGIIGSDGASESGLDPLVRPDSEPADGSGVSAGIVVNAALVAGQLFSPAPAITEGNAATANTKSPGLSIDATEAVRTPVQLQERSPGGIPLVRQPLVEALPAATGVSDSIALAGLPAVTGEVAVMLAEDLPKTVDRADGGDSQQNVKAAGQLSTFEAPRGEARVAHMAGQPIVHPEGKAVDEPLAQHVKPDDRMSGVQPTLQKGAPKVFYPEKDAVTDAKLGSTDSLQADPAQARIRAESALAFSRQAMPIAEEQITMAAARPLGDSVNVPGPSFSDRKEVIDQVVRAMQTMKMASDTEVRVRLEPRELGEVWLRISSTQDGLVADFRVTTETARAAVQQGLQDLRQNLSQAGMKVSTMTCDLGQAFSQSSDAQRQGGQPRRPGYRIRSDGEHQTAPVMQSPWRRSSSLDMIA